MGGGEFLYKFMFTTIVDVIYLNSAGLAFVDITDISCFIYSHRLTWCQEWGDWSEGIL